MGALADASQTPHRRGPPVGSHQDPAVDLRSVTQSRAHPSRALLERLDCAGGQGHAERLEPGPQSSREIVIPDDMPDRPLADVIAFEVEEQRDIVLRHAYSADRLRACAKRPPDPDGCVETL